MKHILVEVRKDENIKMKNLKSKLFIVSMAIGLTLSAQNEGIAKVVKTPSSVIPTTSFGKGINFMAADSSMTMKLNFRMQSLFEAEYNGTDQSVVGSAQIRRSRLKLGGYVFNPRLEYKVELGLSSSDMSVSKEDGNTGGSSRIILDAVLKYKVSKNWAVWVGQTKLPGNRERVVSSADLQFVDRSLVNSKFNIDRDMGFQLHGSLGKGNFIVQPKFAITTGEGRSSSSDNRGGLNYTARLDVLPLGKFEGKKAEYVLSDLDRQSKPKVAFGFTYNYNDRAVRQQGQLGSYVKDTNGEYVQNTLQYFSADMIFKYKGISSLTEFATTTGESGIKGFNTGSGFNTQLGYLFKSNYELAGRFTTIKADNSLSKLSNVSEYTLAFSKYIVGHKLKIQTDLGVQKAENVAKGNIISRLQLEVQF